MFGTLHSCQASAPSADQAGSKTKSPPPDTRRGHSRPDGSTTAICWSVWVLTMQAICRPSGVAVGAETRPSSRVSWRVGPPANASAWSWPSGATKPSVSESIQHRIPPPYEAVGWEPGSAVSRVAGPPSAGTTSTSPRPSKLSRNASQRPSGDQRGSAIARVRATIPAVTFIVVAPSACVSPNEVGIVPSGWPYLLRPHVPAAGPDGESGSRGLWSVAFGPATAASRRRPTGLGRTPFGDAGTQPGPPLRSILLPAVVTARAAWCAASAGSPRPARPDDHPLSSHGGASGPAGGARVQRVGPRGVC